jgi:hypothetical protein
MLTIFLNIICLALIAAGYGVIHSLISVPLAQAGMKKNQFFSFLSGLLGSLGACLLVTYAIHQGMLVLGSYLSSITVGIWGSLQLFGCARQGVNTRVQFTDSSEFERQSFEKENGIDLGAQVYILLGQLWGLLLGIPLAIAYLLVLA